MGSSSRTTRLFDALDVNKGLEVVIERNVTLLNRQTRIPFFAKVRGLGTDWVALLSECTSCGNVLRICFHIELNLLMFRSTFGGMVQLLILVYWTLLSQKLTSKLGDSILQIRSAAMRAIAFVHNLDLSFGAFQV